MFSGWFQELLYISEGARLVNKLSWFQYLFGLFGHIALVRRMDVCRILGHFFAMIAFYGIGWTWFFRFFVENQGS